ncbi:hypothetical protein [Actinoplanes sp. G11-F43]
MPSSGRPIRVWSTTRLATDSAVGTGLTTGPHHDDRFPDVVPA